MDWGPAWLLEILVGVVCPGLLICVVCCGGCAMSYNSVENMKVDVLGVYLFCVLFYPDGALSETCVSWTTSRLCWVHIPPNGPVHIREGKMVSCDSKGLSYCYKTQIVIL